MLVGVGSGVLVGVGSGVLVGVGSGVLVGVGSGVLVGVGVGILVGVGMGVLVGVGVRTGRLSGVCSCVSGVGEAGVGRGASSHADKSMAPSRESMQITTIGTRDIPTFSTRKRRAFTTVYSIYLEEKIVQRTLDAR